MVADLCVDERIHARDGACRYVPATEKYPLSAITSEAALGLELEHGTGTVTASAPFLSSTATPALSRMCNLACCMIERVQRHEQGHRKINLAAPCMTQPIPTNPNPTQPKQYLVIYKELITNFLLALAAVAVLSLLILGRFRIVVLVCFAVVRRFQRAFLFSLYFCCLRPLSRNTYSTAPRT